MKGPERGTDTTGADMVQQLRLERGTAYAAAIESILRTNVASGRWSYYLSRNDGVTMPEYVARLATYYDRYHEYLERLQVKKQDEAWEPLLEKLRRWAYWFLGRYEMEPGERERWAMEIADWAGARLLVTDFPYDTRFEPWARVLLQNVAKEQIRLIGRWGWNGQEVLVDWSRVEEKRPAARLNGKGRELEDRVMNSYDLEAAISQLSEKQQQIIEWYYYDGWSYGEMAEWTEGERPALYKRHHDALNRLRRLME